MDLVQLVVEETRNIAIDAVRRIGKEKVDIDLLSQNLKRLIREGWDTIIADGRAMLEANSSGAMIRATILAQCAVMANKAVALSTK